MPTVTEPATVPDRISAARLDHRHLQDCAKMVIDSRRLIGPLNLSCPEEAPRVCRVPDRRVLSIPSGDSARVPSASPSALSIRMPVIIYVVWVLGL